MEMKMSNVENALTEINNSNIDQIRFFNVEANISNTPLNDIQGKWEICSSKTTSQLSGVAYYFAKKVVEKQKSNVGLIVSAWGATKIEAWMSSSILEKHNDFIEQITIQKNDTNSWSKIYSDYKKEHLKVSESNNGILKGTHLLNYNDSEWKNANYPMTVWSMSLGYYGGFLWLRKTIDIAEKEITDVNLDLGFITGKTDIYINGKFLSTHNNHLKPFNQSVPANLLQKGKNIIALRLCSFWGTGVIGKNSDTPTLTVDNKLYSLNGKWKFSDKEELTFPKMQPLNRNPGSLFNAMVYPLINYTIKGFLWYQGESNAENARLYDEIFPLLIHDWRIHFKQDNLPFLFVQLANYKKKSDFEKNDDWAFLRDAQLKANCLPNTAMATIIDIGDANEIHPINKKTVGDRLYEESALWLYNDSTQYLSPRYISHEIINNKIVLRFKNAYESFMTKDNLPPTGIYIADVNKEFYPADSIEFDRDKIIVSSNLVSKPIAVRYGWASNPNCNIYNSAIKPLTPFRTDDWEQKK